MFILIALVSFIEEGHICRLPFWVYFCNYLSLPHGRFLKGHVSSLKWLLDNGILPVKGGGSFAKERRVRDRKSVV